jgi:hypothetical protein
LLICFRRVGTRILRIKRIFTDFLILQIRKIRKIRVPTRRWQIKTQNPKLKTGFLVYLFLENPDICIARIKSRVRDGGHFVPDLDVRRRFFRSKNNFWKNYRPLVDSWQLILNSENDYQLIAIGTNQNDEFIIEDEARFENFLNNIDDES